MVRARSPFLRAWWLLPLSLLLISPYPLFAKTSLFKNSESPRLVETTELAGFVNDPSVRVVDLRSSLLDYLKGHIPNAVYLHSENLRVPVNGIPAQSPDRICLERLLGESLGISNATWVILYSEKSNPNATFLGWTLDLLGHKRFAVLNGGWEKWVSEGLPTVQAYPSLPPKKFFGKVLRETVAEKKWLRNQLRSKRVVIVDARPSKQYTGEEGEEMRRGHIPGAKNIYWETTLEGDEVKVWKKKEDLEKLFSEAGIMKDKELIVHCRTGSEASHLYFTLKHLLGYPDVRLYRGSWVEWSADPTLPIRTGMNP
jgi:thiosulfate/3-mercaptopyruvate sulfurtransferase